LYGLAVKTGSIALQKFYLFIFFAEKSCLFGVKLFVSRFFSKKIGTLWPSFFDILTGFGVKNVCTLFPEIE